MSIGAEISVAFMVLKPLFSIAWFAFFISPTAHWKMGLMFYVSAIYNAMDIVKAYMNQGGFSVYFQNGPLWAIYLIMAILIPVLFLILAIWITIPQKNKELSEKAQELNKEFVENLKKVNGK